MGTLDLYFEVNSLNVILQTCLCCGFKLAHAADVSDLQVVHSIVIFSSSLLWEDFVAILTWELHFSIFYNNDSLNNLTLGLYDNSEDPLTEKM